MLIIMKIAICSDSHDNLTNIAKFLSYCDQHKTKTIIHCGDWCAPGTLRFFRENFKDEIYGVYGNVFDEKNTSKVAEEQGIKIKNDGLIVKINGLKILITHFQEKAKQFATTNKFDIIFYGHNHKPWFEKVGSTYLINPGTLAGMFSRATFALYDSVTKKIDLKILDQLQ